jgi:hypothetical protein
MKIMANHSSVTVREIPHVTDSIENESSKGKIEALAEMICQAGDEPAAAFLVLMATLQNAPDPKALANMAKHLAFTRCGELNVFGMVDAQIAMLDDTLLAGTTI